MIEFAVIIALLAVVLSQQYAIQKLVNKVMSRDLNDYVRAIAPEPPKAAPQPTLEDVGFDETGTLLS